LNQTPGSLSSTTKALANAIISSGGPSTNKKKHTVLEEDE